MAVLEWDKVGERLYETGTSKGVLYPYDSSAQDKTKAYSPGVAWNGLTAFTESPSGAEANAIYADNIKYLNLRSAEEYGATLEAYTYPEEFAECNGEKYVVKGVKFGQQARKQFGLCVRTEVGNDTEFEEHGYQLHLVYGCSASPSERSYQTINDSPEAITFSWEIDTIPAAVPEAIGAKPVACITIDTTLLDAAGKTALAALEAKLYGTTNGDPYLPLPEEVCTTMGWTAPTP